MRAVTRSRARLIPAHAGKTSEMVCGPYRAPAHPRSRGENDDGHLKIERRHGSSPLTRGKPLASLSGCEIERLIPAHAGKTAWLPACPGHDPAHPRSRGENTVAALALHGNAGSSPLTRGKRLIVDRATWAALAHPRSRGENSVQAAARQRLSGSSPLTRGKHGFVVMREDRTRLIPAHAGKTRSHRRRGTRMAAHPRSRGENSGGERSLAAIAWLIPAHAGKTLPDMRFYCADRSDLGNP